MFAWQQNLTNLGESTTAKLAIAAAVTGAAAAPAATAAAGNAESPKKYLNQTMYIKLLLLLQYEMNDKRHPRHLKPTQGRGRGCNGNLN